MSSSFQDQNSLKIAMTSGLLSSKHLQQIHACTCMYCILLFIHSLGAKIFLNLPMLHANKISKTPIIIQLLPQFHPKRPKEKPTSN